MAITQKDIAEKAQVSRSLVGRVLNGDATIQVSHGKRQLIIRTARELGYQPNLIASNLRKGKTHAVVAICQYDPTGVPSNFMHGVLEELAMEMAEAGYELKVRVLKKTSDTVATIEEIASRSACDAFVLWLADDYGEEAGIAVHKRQMPFVITGYYDQDHPDWHQVDYDHASMMRVAVQHLVDAGRTRIAYVGFNTEQNYARRLLSGYKAAVLEIMGAPASEDWIYKVTSSRHDAEVMTRQWLEMTLNQQPSGVVIGAGTDAWIGIEIALAAQGRRIGLSPDEITVVGQHPGDRTLLYGHGYAFDDIDMERLAVLAAKNIKRQLLGENNVDSIVRISPALTPVVSLCLPLAAGIK